MSDIISRLNDIWRNDDHERGCQGRTYNCTCGFDNRTFKTAEDAVTRIEQLERENAELRADIERYVAISAELATELVSTPVERIPISRIAYNAGIEIRHAIANSGVDPIQHIPEVDAIIERRLIETRREALEEAAKVAARMLVFADTTSSADKEIPAAIRRLAEQEGTE